LFVSTGISIEFCKSTWHQLGEHATFQPTKCAKLQIEHQWELMQASWWTWASMMTSHFKYDQPKPTKCTYQLLLAFCYEGAVQSRFGLRVLRIVHSEFRIALDVRLYTSSFFNACHLYKVVPFLRFYGIFK